MVMNAALGFDSYLVMRHGWKKIAQPQITPVLTKGIIPGHRLGCYFCNDVMAPGDSLRGRTLDQQCTVTRPGVSMMAAALVVEILVSALQHSESFDAPSSISSDVSDIEGPLGLVPHSIRGDIYSHNIVLPATEAFNKCSTCSDIVVETYNREGFEFLKRIFDNPVELEKLTGLDKLQDVSGLIESVDVAFSNVTLLLGSPEKFRHALTVRFMTRRFISEYDPELEGTYLKQDIVDGSELTFRVMDTCDKEGRDPSRYLLWTDAYIVVYSITNHDSFVEAQKYLELISQRDVIIGVVGNKADLEKSREVTYTEGSNLSCQYDATFHEISVAENYSEVENVFLTVAKDFLRLQERSGSWKIPGSLEDRSIGNSFVNNRNKRRRSI
ncbi:hypothetical protein QYM36_009636 [Artemia franciscana]|uniref:small monomeric GTPase n=1 Tax=Artemia franciscana TaxID=6661 RepID=A0AA88L008_ARTSF|nr:hypothetical protein QYM36_009636 [Artemia franciscana]